MSLFALLVTSLLQTGWWWKVAVAPGPSHEASMQQQADLHSYSAACVPLKMTVNDFGSFLLKT